MGKGSLSSSSSSSSCSSGGGKTIYFEGVSCGLRPKSGGGLSPEAAPPSSPAKRGRTGVVHGAQPPRCQVEGCKVDLSDAKAYYCRHKVCGVHSKSPKVIVAGIEQRFCQQCSRFHQLSEFDQGKRSCRRRLAGHNERRRKPPPGPLLSSRYGTLSPSTLDNHSLTGGGFVMDFSAYSNLARRDRSWANTNPERGFENNLTGKHQQLPWQSSSYNQPPPLPPHNYAEPEQACFSGASESSSALSLLSNHPTSLGVNTFPAAATNDSMPSAQPPNNIGQFSWGFTNQGNSDSATHEMHADMGLAQISHEAQYGGGLELAQPSHGQYEVEASSGYDSCTQHMHWSL